MSLHCSFELCSRAVQIQARFVKRSVLWIIHSISIKICSQQWILLEIFVQVKEFLDEKSTCFKL